MNMSDDISKISAALCLAQGEMKNPAFDAQNPHFKSKYASLVSVREAVLPVLNKHGLALAQYPKAAPGFAGCVNVLCHTSGQYLIEECLLPLDKQNAHGAGSCITYARRYSLQSIAGVVADEDDDANASVQAPKQSAKPITVDEWDKLEPDEQKRLQFIADCVRAEFDKSGAAAAVKMLEEQKLHNDEKVCLWSRFDSKERAAMKKVNESKVA